MGEFGAGPIPAPDRSRGWGDPDIEVGYGHDFGVGSRFVTAAVAVSAADPEKAALGAILYLHSG